MKKDVTTLYVISTKYQPLVTVDVRPTIQLNPRRKPIRNKAVSKDDLLATFEASRAGALIACENEVDARNVMSLLLKMYGGAPEYADKGTEFLAVPVVYTVEQDGALLPKATALTADDLVNYADTTTIPLYHSDSSAEDEKQHLTRSIEQVSRPIMIRKLQGLQLNNVVEAIYLGSNGVSYNSAKLTNKPNVTMAILSGFIAAIGIAAVAVAFLALNAATFGAFGVAVAVIGVTAAVLGSVGMFKSIKKPDHPTPTPSSVATATV